MNLILRFLANAAALYITVYLWRLISPTGGLYLDPGMAGFEGAAIAAVLLGIVNTIIRPIMELIALPITCLTLGLFTIVINAVLFYLVGQFTPHFHVSGFVPAIFGTLVMGLISSILGFFVGGSSKKSNTQSS
jgi:putative membrane protein